MRKGSKARLANGVVSAVIVVFFIAHATLGSLAPVTGFSSPYRWLVWCGVALVAVHVLVSIATSWEQLSDKEHPPSPRKKRHLALKWATGSLLLATAAAHVIALRTQGVASMHASVSGALVIAVLSIALAVHLCVGSKSLLKDLGIDRRYKTAFRIVVCAFAAAFAVGALAMALA